MISPEDRAQLTLEREKVKNLTARLLHQFDDGDHGVGQYLRLSTESWTRPYEGVAQTLCPLSSVQNHTTISNIVFEPGASMFAHRHDRHETMFVLDGELEEVVSGDKLLANSYKEIPSGQRHGWRTEKGALAAVLWKPALSADGPDVPGGLVESAAC